MLMEERDLIWKFRFWLKSNPKALTKFVRSVNWQEKLEVRQAIQVILYNFRIYVYNLILNGTHLLESGNQSMHMKLWNFSLRTSAILLFVAMQFLDFNALLTQIFSSFCRNLSRHYAMNQINMIWLQAAMKIC